MTTPEQARLAAKTKQLKLLMFMMLAFIVAGPLLAPIMFANEFSKLGRTGRTFFYLSTPIVFGALFLFYWLLYRRIEKQRRGDE